MKRLLYAILLACLFGLVFVLPAAAEDPTPTFTPTPTATFTATPSGASIVWAEGLVSLSADLTNAIASLLASDPPEDASTSVYALTHVSGASTSWAVSVINLAGVSAPYTEWNAEVNGVWAGTLECTGTDPYWTCSYLTTAASGGSSGMVLPWQGGYYAIYGVNGVHRDTNSIVSGSYAVDFVGDGTSAIMPDSVIAVASGTITWVCSDGVSMAIRVDGGPVDVAYFHFETGQVFNEGDTVQQGEVLGQLKHGTFSGPANGCGWGSQNSNQYHLHFVFLPTTTGYLEIGDAVLDLTTGNFVANGNTYPPLSQIPNNGAPSVIDPDNDTDGSSTASGGAHLWDGIVDAIVRLNEDAVAEFLPEQDPVVVTLLEKMKLIFDVALSLFVLLYVNGMTGTFLLLCLVSIIGLESTYWSFKIGLFLYRLVF